MHRYVSEQMTFWLPNERGTQNAMGIRIPITRTWRCSSDVDFPAVDQLFSSLNFVTGDETSTAILVNRDISFSVLLFVREKMFEIQRVVTS